MLKTDFLKYRSDIDGIRGIAVLLVIAFHFSPNLVTGGFVGVDVFFVISGYLISSIIFSDILNGKFSVKRFYERRIKRIFPSLITVLSGALILGWLFLWPTEYRNMGKHVVGGAGFISNILLWRETGYFAEQAEFKPLLHLWSLGVEEQFYILFPVGVWLLYEVRPVAIVSALGVAFAASFAICAQGTQTHPSATFYLPATRLWELLAGCILASLHRDYRSHLCPPRFLALFPCFQANSVLPLVRNVSSLLGVLMIVGTALFLTKAQPFPGAWALIPTTGTVLLIFSGKDSFINRKILSNKILVAVGLISYPLYLWHWPLLFFLRILTGGFLSGPAIAGTVGMSFVLATLTYLYIEKPIRFGGLLGRKTVLVLCSTMAVVLLVGAFAKTQTLPSRLGLGPVGKEVEEAVNDWDYPFKDNFMRRSGFEKDTEIGSDKAGYTVLFIGDSHMQQYWPRIKAVLSNSQSNRCAITFITAGGSPTLPHVNRCKPGYSCDKFFDFAMNEAERTEVGTVVFSCNWPSYFLGEFPEGEPESIYYTGDRERTPLRLGLAGTDKVFDEFGQTIRRLVGMGKQAFVILSSPSCSKWSPKSMPRVRFGTGRIDRLGVSEKSFDDYVFALEKTVTDVVVENGGKVLNPRDGMQEGGFFYGRTASGRFRYMDSNHMRPFYVRENASFIDTIIGVH